MVCVCGKQVYLSEALARSMAQLLSWKYGKEYGVHQCRFDSRNWHTTTSEWRRERMQRRRIGLPRELVMDYLFEEENVNGYEFVTKQRVDAYDRWMEHWILVIQAPDGTYFGAPYQIGKTEYQENNLFGGPYDSGEPVEFMEMFRREKVEVVYE